jgi:hypothetical protein
MEHDMNFFAGKPDWSRVVLIFLLFLSVAFNVILFRSALYDETAMKYMEHNICHFKPPLD